MEYGPEGRGYRRLNSAVLALAADMHGKDGFMNAILRVADFGDAPECGRICYEAFQAIGDAHRFPNYWRSAEAATAMFDGLIKHPEWHGVVAEREGKVIGSNFMDERSPIYGVGPTSVDPKQQDNGVGQRMMRGLLDRAATRRVPGVRLTQTAYHNRSLCLYSKLGFQTREPLSLMQGPPLNAVLAGYHVRPAQAADIESCGALSQEILGFDRGGGALRDAVNGKTAMVVEHLGRITGYTTLVGLSGHSVARTNRDLMALIGAAPEFQGAGFLVPTRNYEVFSWCLANSLRLVVQWTLMSVGLYNEPAGAYLPSGMF
jgi:predicted N-acetyltransferase YhbS